MTNISIYETMTLSVLEGRLKERLPEQAHDVIEEEFARYEVETSLMSNEPDKLGQARLTEHEISRLPMGNQHTKWNIIKWQCVKAAAMEYGVPDWTAKVDRTLTYEENISRMQSRATRNGGPTLKQITAHD